MIPTDSWAATSACWKRRVTSLITFVNSAGVTLSPESFVAISSTSEGGRLAPSRLAMSRILSPTVSRPLFLVSDINSLASEVGALFRYARIVAFLVLAIFLELGFREEVHLLLSNGRRAG